jgi:hypothetical protein
MRIAVLVVVLVVSRGLVCDYVTTFRLVVVFVLSGVWVEAGTRTEAVLESTWALGQRDHHCILGD